MVRRHTCCNPCCNLLPDDKDEFAKSSTGASTKSNNTLTLFLAVFWAQTPIPTLALTSNSNKKLCQQFVKTYAVTIKLLEQNHRFSPCK